MKFGTAWNNSEDSECDTYNIEMLKGIQRNEPTNQFEFLVKWTGYVNSQNTWETFESFSGPEICE